jgi:hypothetical protein
MEQYLELQQKALDYLKKAEQGVNFTYKLVQDNKVLMTVVNNLFLASTSIMGSLLHYEQMYKRIPVFEDNFESKMRIFKSRVRERYNLDPGYIRMMRDLKDIIVAHHESPVEFSKGKKFIICNDNYELKEITAESLKKTLSKTKIFIDEVISLTKQKH